MSQNHQSEEYSPHGDAAPNKQTASDTAQESNSLDSPRDPSPLGQNSDANESQHEPDNAMVPTIEVESVQQTDDHAIKQSEDAITAEPNYGSEPNTSVTLPAASNKSFTTPSKALPPLKDIEHITTPKSFGVAQDETRSDPNFKSSPVVNPDSIRLRDLAEGDEDAFDATVNDTFASASDQNPNHKISEGTDLEAAANFLDVDPKVLMAVGLNVVAKIAQRSHEFQGLHSEFSFFKLNQEQMSHVQKSKIDSYEQHLEKLSNTNDILSRQNESRESELQSKSDLITKLTSQISDYTQKLSKLESSNSNSENLHSSALASKDQEIIQLNESINMLTGSNIEQGRKLSELTKQLNELTNEKFSTRLQLTQATNELTYTKEQKTWYEEQLKSVQEKYTELIKRHETEFLKDSTNIATLTTQNETLNSLKTQLSKEVRELQDALEKFKSLSHDLETKLEQQASKFSKDCSTKDDTIELLNIQLEERKERITQLENYAEDIKSSTADSIGNLQNDLSEKDDKLAHLEEKLRRTEMALDAELHKETELPKLSASAELMLQVNPEGISLSTLYSEFNHIKKELILEKSQKEKLAVQLQHFVTELESRKPAIANYRNQIAFYEDSLKELTERLEDVRTEKIESEKECNRLRTRLASNEIELNSIKQLSKDLGRQLCFYLIHSKIRNNQEDPLTSHERRVIDQILAKSGASETEIETDTDKLINERLIGFANIIELQKKNEELTVAVRLLGKQLEEKDTEANGLEAAAVEEAREAILTLQGELDSVTIKYDAVVKERDLLQSLSKGHTSENVTSDSQLLKDINSELKAKLDDSEKSVRKLQAQSEEKYKVLNGKLSESSRLCDELKVQLNAANYTVQISQNRLENTEKLLQSSRRESDQYRKELNFWKEQSAKQEAMLVSKSNELRDVERELMSSTSICKNHETESEVWASLKSSLKEEIRRLEKDKDHLNSFVFNLQNLLKEREASSQELSKRFAQSVENYQSLQATLLEKDEKISILTSQSDLALKAQNAKLEQVNELSQKLLDARNMLVEKQSQVEILKKKFESGHSASHVQSLPAKSADHVLTEGSMVLASEYEDLKNALRLAETQVSEFSAIAKSAEEALMKANESFDQHRELADGKIRLLTDEKKKLIEKVETCESEIEKLHQQLELLDDEKSKQLEDLKTEADKNASKANSYDVMTADFERKLTAVNDDMKNQIAIFENLQQRYDSKISESESLNSRLIEQTQMVADLKTQVEKLSSELEETNSELKAKDGNLHEQISIRNEELQAAQIKIHDLQYQYDLAISQLELQKAPSSEESSSDDNLRQVISFLRGEKESAEAKTKSLEDQLARTRLQMESLSSELRASKSQVQRLQSMKVEIEDWNKEHSRLVEQLEQLNIMRESNSTLRLENKSMLERIEELQSEIEHLKTAANDSNIEMQGIDENLVTQEIHLLKEENDRLKSQLNNNDELKNLMQRFENLKSEFKTKLSGHRNKNKELEKELNEIKEANDAMKKQLAEVKSTLDERTVESASLKSQLESSESQKATAEKKFLGELKALKESFEKEKSTITKNLNLKIAAAQESASSVSNNNGFETELRNRIENEWKEKSQKEMNELKSKYEKDLENSISARVEERLSQLDKKTSPQELNGARDALVKEYESKIAQLNGAFETRLAQEKSKVEKAIDKKYELKLKVLNRKLDRLEKAQKNDSPAEGNISSNLRPEKGSQFGTGSSKNSATSSGAQNVEDSKPEDQNQKKRSLPNNPPTVNFKRSKE